MQTYFPAGRPSLGPEIKWAKRYTARSWDGAEHHSSSREFSCRRQLDKSSSDLLDDLELSEIYQGFIYGWDCIFLLREWELSSDWPETWSCAEKHRDVNYGGRHHDVLPGKKRIRDITFKQCLKHEFLKSFL